jgi:hypothetical protein
MKGLSAEPGWDLVTGLGTPNFQRLLDLIVDHDATWGLDK